jgi:hypothetical protein
LLAGLRCSPFAVRNARFSPTISFPWLSGRISDFSRTKTTTCPAEAMAKAKHEDEFRTSDFQVSGRDGLRAVRLIKCPLTNTGKKWDGTEAVPPIDERTLHGTYIMRTGWPVHSNTACHRSPSGSNRRRPCVTRSKGMWTNVLCHRPISVFVLPAIAA